MTFTAPTLPLETYGEANIRLGKIEAEENVTILFAVESGSRAWGFPSPDSDNDVRFFYVRPLSHYLGLDDPRDVIERPIDGLWDLNGWELRKTLRLLVKGNATAAEWLNSPLIYREHGPFPAKMRDLIKRHASPQASAKHYYGLTKRCFDSEIGNAFSKEQQQEFRRGGTMGLKVPEVREVNYKKYLYAVRGACAISWIKNYSEIPPMTLPALLSLDIIDADAREALDKLLKAKATMGECGYGPRIKVLDDFILNQLAWVKFSGLEATPVEPTFVRGAERLLLDALGVG